MLAERDLGGICQIKGELSRRRIPVAGIDLEAIQDDLLQPGRRARDERAWRNWIAIEPLAQLAEATRAAEREASGGELIENASERVDVTARIAAHAQHLLGRHVDPVTDGKTKLLSQQVGKMAVVGQPELEQNRFTARP